MKNNLSFYYNDRSNKKFINVKIEGQSYLNYFSNKGIFNSLSDTLSDYVYLDEGDEMIYFQIKGIEKNMEILKKAKSEIDNYICEENNKNN